MRMNAGTRTLRNPRPSRCQSGCQGFTRLRGIPIWSSFLPLRVGWWGMRPETAGARLELLVLAQGVEP